MMIGCLVSVTQAGIGPPMRCCSGVRNVFFNMHPDDKPQVWFIGPFIENGMVTCQQDDGGASKIIIMPLSILHVPAKIHCQRTMAARLCASPAILQENKVWHDDLFPTHSGTK